MNNNNSVSGIPSADDAVVPPDGAKAEPRRSPPMPVRCQCFPRKICSLSALLKLAEVTIAIIVPIIGRITDCLGIAAVTHGLAVLLLAVIFLQAFFWLCIVSNVLQRCRMTCSRPRLIEFIVTSILAAIGFVIVPMFHIWSAHIVCYKGHSNTLSLVPGFLSILLEGVLVVDTAVSYKIMMKERQENQAGRLTV